MAETNWDESVILDEGHLSTFTGGDPDFENQILDIFLDNAPTYLTALIDVDGGNWKATAHKLKGAARSIGAWRLAREAERAEHLGAPAIDDRRRMATISELQLRMENLVHHIKERK
ncbi:MAG: Hpt domain-containing protein [Kordiimonas sp.]